VADDGSKAHVALLLLLTIAGSIVYVLVIPPWQTPDEPSHFGYMRFVIRSQCLPAFEAIPVAEEILASMSGFGFWKLRYHAIEPTFPAEVTEFRVASRHPPLYYLLGTLLVVPLKDTDIVHQLYVLRLASVLMGALTVLVAFRTMRMLFPRDPILALTVSSFIALLPMRSFVSASVNNDNLAELLASVVVYVLIRVLRDGISPLKGLGITGLLVAGYLTKRTTFFTISLVLLTMPIYLCTRTYQIRESWLTTPRRLTGLMLEAWERRTMLVGGQAIDRRIAVMTLIGFLCGAIGLVIIGQKEFARRHTDPGVQITRTGQIELPLLAEQDGRAQPACLEITVPQILKFARISPARIAKPLSPTARGASAMSSYVLFSLLTFASFWANFGWMNIPLDPAWYAILAVVSLISLLGLVLRVLREIRPSGERTLLPERWQKGGFLVLLLVSVLAFAQTFLLMVIRDAAGQGRYLFPAIVPLATLFVLGLREFVPPLYRHSVFPVCILLCLFLFDAICLTYYVIPYFYG
jgi:hypothetical protein